jgi:hypothetical protein
MKQLTATQRAKRYLDAAVRIEQRINAWACCAIASIDDSESPDRAVNEDTCPEFYLFKPDAIFGDAYYYGVWFGMEKNLKENREARIHALLFSYHMAKDAAKKERKKNK